MQKRIVIAGAAILLTMAATDALGHELTYAQVDPSTVDGLASIVTERTGELCAFPILFDFGPDWVLTCANAPTVWTLGADGNLYKNGDIKTAFERNFR